MVHHSAAFVDVRVLATAEQNRDLNFVVVLKKPDRLLDLEPDIMLAGFGPNANFFQLGLVGLALGLFFGFVVFEFAIVHDPANRRFGVTGNFYQVQPSFVSSFHRLFSWDHSQLFAIGVNHANGCNTNLPVDPVLILFLFDFCYLWLNK